MTCTPFSQLISHHVYRNKYRKNMCKWCTIVDSLFGLFFIFNGIMVCSFCLMVLCRYNVQLLTSYLMCYFSYLSLVMMYHVCHLFVSWTVIKFRNFSFVRVLSSTGDVQNQDRDTKLVPEIYSYTLRFRITGFYSLWKEFQRNAQTKDICFIVQHLPQKPFFFFRFTVKYNPFFFF